MIYLIIKENKERPNYCSSCKSNEFLHISEFNVNDVKVIHRTCTKCRITQVERLPKIIIDKLIFQKTFV